MTAAGVPATDDSGRVRRGGHCAAGRHYDCSGHLGCDCECHSEPTPTRPGTAEMREEIAEIIFGAPRQYRLHSDTNFRRWGGAVTKADAVLATDGVQRLLAVEQRVRDALAELRAHERGIVERLNKSADAGIEYGPSEWRLHGDARGHRLAIEEITRALGGGDDA